jgi:hypothetical protein
MLTDAEGAHDAGCRTGFIHLAPAGWAETQTMNIAEM